MIVAVCWSAPGHSHASSNAFSGLGSRASRRAMARPMPLTAPVTTATLPINACPVAHLADPDPVPHVRRRDGLTRRWRLSYSWSMTQGRAGERPVMEGKPRREAGTVRRPLAPQDRRRTERPAGEAGDVPRRVRLAQA